MSVKNHQGRTRVSAALLVTVCCGTTWVAGRARADTSSDGAYGRLDGDLTLSLAAGVSEAFPGESLHARFAGLYLHTVGVFGQYDESFDAGAQPMARSVAYGVELRPLFLPRFALDLERGPAHADLLLDSLSAGLAAYAEQGPPQICDEQPDRCWHWGMQLHAGVELPLLGRVDGPFIALRGALRLPESTPGAGDAPSPGVSGMASLSLGYRLQIEAHIVDVGDRLR